MCQHQIWNMDPIWMTRISVKSEGIGKLPVYSKIWKNSGIEEGIEDM